MLCSRKERGLKSKHVVKKYILCSVVRWKERRLKKNLLGNMEGGKKKAEKIYC